MQLLKINVIQKRNRIDEIANPIKEVAIETLQRGKDDLVFGSRDPKRDVP